MSTIRETEGDNPEQSPNRIRHLGHTRYVKTQVLPGTSESKVYAYTLKQHPNFKIAFLCM